MATYQSVKYETPYQPIQVRLDTDTRCNAKCPSCHRFLTKRHGKMSFDYFKFCLESIRKLPEPLFEIVPVNYGEFLLQEDWQTKLQMIANYLPKTRITLPTNGSTMDEETVLKLCAIRTLKVINFSVNAYFDETYEWFMGLPPDTMRKIETSIHRIRMIRPDIDAHVSFVYDPMYQSDFERDSFKIYWNSKNVKSWIIAAQSARRPDKSCNPINKIPCRSIYSDFVIGFDGMISLCCFDAGFSLDLGQFSGDIIKDWHSEKLTQLREAHNNGERDTYFLCRGCTSA